MALGGRVALAATGPALAEQPAGGLWERLPGPPPADSGKAMIRPPPVSAAEERDGGRCAGELPCGARLIGTVRKNGVVELQVPALRW